MPKKSVLALSITQRQRRACEFAEELKAFVQGYEERRKDAEFKGQIKAFLKNPDNFAPGRFITEIGAFLKILDTKDRREVFATEAARIIEAELDIFAQLVSILTLPGLGPEDARRVLNFCSILSNLCEKAFAELKKLPAVSAY